MKVSPAIEWLYSRGTHQQERDLVPSQVDVLVWEHLGQLLHEGDLPIERTVKVLTSRRRRPHPLPGGYTGLGTPGWVPSWRRRGRCRWCWESGRLVRSCHPASLYCNTWSAGPAVPYPTTACALRVKIINVIERVRTVSVWHYKFYRPQTNFAKVIFLHLSVSHSVHGGRCLVLGEFLVLERGVPGLGGAWSQGGLQAHNQGGSWGGSGPGLHPRGELRGIWSRPTTKGELRGIWSRPTPKGEVEGNWPGPPPPDGYCCGRYASYWNAFLFR